MASGKMVTDRCKHVMQLILTGMSTHIRSHNDWYHKHLTFSHAHFELIASFPVHRRVGKFCFVFQSKDPGIKWIYSTTTITTLVPNRKTYSS